MKWVYQLVRVPKLDSCLKPNDQTKLTLSKSLISHKPDILNKIDVKKVCYKFILFELSMRCFNRTRFMFSSNFFLIHFERQKKFHKTMDDLKNLWNWFSFANSSIDIETMGFTWKKDSWFSHKKFFGKRQTMCCCMHEIQIVFFSSILLHRR